MSLISLIYFCYVLLILAQVTYCSQSITRYIAFTHTYSGIYRGFIDSSLIKGLNTTDHNMLFPSNSKACALSLYISSPFMTYRTPVSQNLFDMVVPTIAKPLTPFTPLSSSLLGPLVLLYCGLPSATCFHVIS